MTESCNSCLYASKIAELERDAERNSTQHREFYAKFAGQDKQLAIAEERYTNLLTVMSEVKTDVAEIKNRPAKRWDSVVACAITAIVSGVVGALIGVIL